jgi:hypothetical protein
MIQKIQASRSLRLDDDKTLQKWRRELQATMVLVHTVLKDGETALSLAKESLLADPLWLLTFLRCGALAVARRARTQLRMWAQDRV